MSQATLSPNSTTNNGFAGRDDFAPVKRRYASTIWNGKTYRVQSLNAKEEGIYENLVAPGGSPKFDLMKCARVLVSAVDGDNVRIFGNNELEKVGACDPDLIKELFSLCLQVKAPEVEKTAKN